MPVLLVAVLAIVGPACGDSAEKSGSATTTTAAAATTTSAVPRQTSAPRWETVSTFTGTADATTPTFAIAPDVIQWRVRWHCESGHLTIESDPKQQRHPEPTVDAPCVGPDATPEKAVGYGIVEGQVKLVVKATSPWQITVDQQIDTPLLEPPLPGMDTAKVLGQGEFYDIEMKGKGKARMLELADGSRALRLEDFEVSSNTDLFLWLSEAPAPKTSKDAVDAPYVVLGNLKSTLGNENYVLPADLPPERIRSIVIWCAPVRIAYTAAVLAPPS
ncbi:MAG TPA: DM13 domain-containing protein [Acidimicrobiales bacterium]|nr:DM13 domain-containing protein [Acidimicrobiales bacterium]